MQAPVNSLQLSHLGFQRAVRPMVKLGCGAPMAMLGFAGQSAKPSTLYRSPSLHAPNSCLLTCRGKPATKKMCTPRASDNACDNQSTWEDKLYAALQSVEAPGKFATSAAYTQDLSATPLITVQGVGPLSVPLSMRQAAALLLAGEPAPYGKGMATEYDEAVRRATQLEPGLVSPAAAWTEALSSITRATANDLGVDPDCPVEAHLYKVLVYEPGGHFVVHRDTEKEPGMFGTLVVQLPVSGGHAGGSLEVTGPTGQKHVWRTAKGSSTSLQYCAFYADMEHQLMPVECGLRVVLTYNLVRPGQGLRPEPSRCFSDAALEQVTAAVKEWEELSGAASGGVKQQLSLRAVALEHRYTKTNFSVGNLKGRDSALVGLLRSCPALDVQLALVTRKVTGQGFEEQDVGRQKQFYKKHKQSNGDEEDADDDHHDVARDQAHYGPKFDMSEVFEEEHITKWASCTPTYPQLCALDFKKDFLGGGPFPEDLATRLPDEEEFEPYTGNEGPTIEYQYHRAAVVFWPRPYLVRVAFGIDDMLQLVAKRLQDADLGQAAADMAEALQRLGDYRPVRDRWGIVHSGLLQLVGKPLQDGDSRQAESSEAVATQLVEDAEGKLRTKWDYVPTTTFHGQVMQALQLVCQLADSATTASGNSEAILLGVWLVHIIILYGITSADMAQALAEADAKLSSDKFDFAIEALITAAGPKHLGSCIQLVAASSASRARQQRSWSALMTSLGIHQQGGQLPKSYSVDDVVALARVLLEGVEGIPRTLVDAHIEFFVEAVLAHPDSQTLLMALFKDQVVRKAAKDSRVVPLVKARVAELEARTSQGPAEFSWRMPDAVLPGKPEFQEFLRGPEKQFQSDVSSVWDNQMKTWVNTYFGKDAIGGWGYSARAEVAWDKGSYRCTITKTESWYESQVKELADLSSLL